MPTTTGGMARRTHKKYSIGPNRALPDSLTGDITAVQILPGEGIPNSGFARVLGVWAVAGG